MSIDARATTRRTTRTLNRFTRARRKPSLALLAESQRWGRWFLRACLRARERGMMKNEEMDCDRASATRRRRRLKAKSRARAWR